MREFHTFWVNSFREKKVGHYFLSSPRRKLFSGCETRSTESVPTVVLRYTLIPRKLCINSQVFTMQEHKDFITIQQHSGPVKSNLCYGNIRDYSPLYFSHNKSHYFGALQWQNYSGLSNSICVLCAILQNALCEKLPYVPPSRMKNKRRQTTADVQIITKE